MHIICGNAFVFSQWRCDTLCISVLWMTSYLFIMGSMTQVGHTCKLKVTQQGQHGFDTAGSQHILNMTHQGGAPDRGWSLMSTITSCSSYMLRFNILGIVYEQKSFNIKFQFLTKELRGRGMISPGEQGSKG